ncbi:unnamed protein product [Vitrella brassicaformis CCMP3155]|uniref:Uncharacterized protein n=1 Tax=Vitrella brassicaformis (strain CCMP3155) TaxID=1169540 RepID=A0A0G4EQM7_VITBC|nr:unnamed protein product [Vitrella brassicaformis CCMP3155]|eukprot:CEL99740.1 unnamed protein product [Vitrella brassicaformis CCMP3155]
MSADPALPPPGAGVPAQSAREALAPGTKQVPYDWRFPVVSQRVKAVKLLRTSITSHYLPPKMVSRRITTLTRVDPVGVAPHIASYISYPEASYVSLVLRLILNLRGDFILGLLPVDAKQHKLRDECLKAASEAMGRDEGMGKGHASTQTNVVAVESSEAQTEETPSPPDAVDEEQQTKITTPTNKIKQSMIAFMMAESQAKYTKNMRQIQATYVAKVRALGPPPISTPHTLPHAGMVPKKRQASFEDDGGEDKKVAPGTAEARLQAANLYAREGETQQAHHAHKEHQQDDQDDAEDADEFARHFEQRGDLPQAEGDQDDNGEEAREVAAEEEQRRKMAAEEEEQRREMAAKEEEQRRLRAAGQEQRREVAEQEAAEEEQHEQKRQQEEAAERDREALDEQHEQQDDQQPAAIQVQHKYVQLWSEAWIQVRPPVVVAVEPVPIHSAAHRQEAAEREGPVEQDDEQQDDQQQPAAIQHKYVYLWSQAWTQLRPPIVVRTMRRTLGYRLLAVGPAPIQPAALKAAERRKERLRMMKRLQELLAEFYIWRSHISLASRLMSRPTR